MDNPNVVPGGLPATGVLPAVQLHPNIAQPGGAGVVPLPPPPSSPVPVPTPPSMTQQMPSAQTQVAQPQQITNAVAQQAVTAQTGAPVGAQVMVTGDTRGFSLAPSQPIPAPVHAPVAAPSPPPLPQGAPDALAMSQVQSVPTSSQLVQPQVSAPLVVQFAGIPPAPGAQPATALPPQTAPTVLKPGAPMLDTISPSASAPTTPSPVPASASSAVAASGITKPAMAKPDPFVSKASKRSSLAIAALIVGIMAVILEIFISNLTNFIIAVAPVSLAAIGLGVPALGSPRRGLAIAGVVLGSLSLVSVIILFSVNLATQSRCQLNPTSDPQCQAVQTTQTTGVSQ